MIRVSGPGAGLAVRALTGRPPPAARQLVLRLLRDPASGEVLDRALVFHARGPATETGEDLAELHLHGGGAVRRAVLAALGALPGLRPADAGEFARRAFANGRIDLTQAEALADLVAAETAAERRQALAQMGGALGQLYDRWRTRLIHAAALAEAAIDFPDEDVPASVLRDCQTQILLLYDEMTRHLEDARRGELVREGLSIAIVGATNVGKSTLLNRLAGREAAIVAATAGTTRDVIEVQLDVAGYRAILADTAGLRQAADEVESEGVRRSLARAAAADIRMVVLDAAAPEVPLDILALIDESALVVANKSDLRGGDTGVAVPGIPVSATTGAGIPALWQALEDRVRARLEMSGGVPLTRERHRRALLDARAALGVVIGDPGLAPELVAEEVRIAAHAIGRITGRVDVEDILDVVFREFCIGK